MILSVGFPVPSLTGGQMAHHGTAAAQTGVQLRRFCEGVGSEWATYRTRAMSRAGCSWREAQGSGLSAEADVERSAVVGWLLSARVDRP